ncbi:MAG: hypothetical protein IJF16_03885 [Clostridia bacterium]|nr:hypothetical protein [Clostridia bacterium]
MFNTTLKGLFDMKNAIKRLLGMALSLCVMASTFAIPTANAQENQQGEGQGTPQENQVQIITDVKISGVDRPIIGEEIPKYLEGITVDEQADYEIESKSLKKAGSEEEPTDTAFTAGTAYDLKIVLAPKDSTTEFPASLDDINLSGANKIAMDSGKLTAGANNFKAVYSVKLNHNYGDPATVESKLTDASYKLSEADLTISRDGWELKGWNTSSNGNGTEITKDTVFDGSVTEIFAIWEEVKTIDIEITGVTEPKFNEAPTVEGITITSGYKAEYKWLIKDGENWKDNTDTAFGHGAQYALQAVITLDENASASLDSDKSVSVNGTEYTATPANNSLTVIHPFGVLAHSPQKVEKNDSTCKEFGKAEHWKCECGVLFSDEEGNTVVTEDQLKIEKKEHIPEEEWTVDKEPTTSSQGHRYKKCTKCGDVVAEENIASLISNVEYEFICVHADTTTHGAYPATCTSNGYTGNVACSWCGQVMSMGKTIPAIGHNYVNGVCQNCGHVYGNISSGGSSNSGTTGSGSGNWIPQTGDESQPMIYIALIILSVAGIASACFLGKKRGTSKR